MKTEIKMKRDIAKECKHVVRFVTDDPKACVTNVYVSKAADQIATANEITVTVQAGS